jgi:sodium/bile acid cotransporter 7
MDEQRTPSTSRNPSVLGLDDVSAKPEHKTAPLRSGWTRRLLGWARVVFDLVISQWLLLAMGLVIGLAYCFPSVGKHGGYIASQWTVTYGAVILIFFVSGLSLPFDKLLQHTRNIRLHLIVQAMSFLVTSAVFFGVACAAQTNPVLDISTLVGLVATGALPTTISSNVVMTKQAGGDEAATMVEVTLGNFLGPFISPLLITKLYLPAVTEFKAWLPAEATHDLPKLYRRVMLQMGTSVFAPLALGQVIRGIWPKRVAWVVLKFKLGKLGSLCLLSLIWWASPASEADKRSTFCTAFASKSLESINMPTIVFNVFINLTLCIFFTVMAFSLARPPQFLHRMSPFIFRRADKPEAISICFCAPAKTQALGIPLIAAMYSTATDKTRALIQVPMILYTAEQILVGQVMVALFKRWNKQDVKPNVEEGGPPTLAEPMVTEIEKT